MSESDSSINALLEKESTPIAKKDDDVLLELNRISDLITTGFRTIRKEIEELHEEVKKMKPPVVESCSFCHKIHPTIDCRQYRGYANRIGRASELQLCLSCLSQAHTPAPCKKKTSCSRCNQENLHAALCPCRDKRADNPKERPEPKQQRH